MHDVVLELLAQAITERARAGLVLIDGSVFPERTQFVNERNIFRTSGLQRPESAKRRGMRVNQVKGLALRQFKNSVSNQAYNNSFSEARHSSGNGPLGKSATQRHPAVGDVFHNGFYCIWIVHELERPAQSLGTEAHAVLRGNEMQAADAVARVYRAGMIEHVQDTQRQHR